MADRSAIEWTDTTWNPTTGCNRVSPGCDNCYALKLAKRLKGMGSAKYQTDGDPRTSGPGFGVAMHDDTLDTPLGWKKPRRVFVNSMSDLFHDEVTDAFIAKVFAVMSRTPQHTYQILTKRHGRMSALLNSGRFWIMVNAERLRSAVPVLRGGGPVLLPNVWLGVSVESQQWANIRIPTLLGTPAVVRFVSAEPGLGGTQLNRLGPFRRQSGTIDALRGRSWVNSIAGDDVARIDWVIAGGESGPGARPMHPDWARSLRDQCAAAGVAFFFKQWGEWAPVGPLYEQSDDDTAADEARMEAVSLEVIAGVDVVLLERSGYVADEYQPVDPRTWLMARLGKKQAGRALDGRTHDEYPGVAGG